MSSKAMDIKELKDVAIELMDALRSKNLGEVELELDDVKIKIKAAAPAPKFSTAREEPLSFGFTMEGIRAESGTKPASRMPKIAPRTMETAKLPEAIEAKYHNGTEIAHPMHPNHMTVRRQPKRSPKTPKNRLAPMLAA